MKKTMKQTIYLLLGLFLFSASGNVRAEILPDEVCTVTESEDTRGVGTLQAALDYVNHRNQQERRCKKALLFDFDKMNVWTPLELYFPETPGGSNLPADEKYQFGGVDGKVVTLDFGNMGFYNV